MGGFIQVTVLKDIGETVNGGDSHNFLSIKMFVVHVGFILV